MDVSIIIPTKNGGELFEQVLDVYKRQGIWFTSRRWKELFL